MPRQSLARQQRLRALEPKLRRWYAEDGLTLAEIGRLMGRHESTVWRWFRALGIPTREQHWALPASSATNKVEVA